MWRAKSFFEGTAAKRAHPAPISSRLQNACWEKPPKNDITAAASVKESETAYWPSGAKTPQTSEATVITGNKNLEEAETESEAAAQTPKRQETAAPL